MRRRYSSTLVAALGIILLPLWAQSPQKDPTAPAQASQPHSQPGAQGKEIAITQPSVPVPPGPVPPREIKPAPPTPIAVKKVELGSDSTWNPQWDVFIEENLPPDLLAPDVDRAVRPFCPRFGQLTDADKRAFWAYLFQALAGAEAGLRPTAAVRHSDPTVAVVDRVTHHIARQEGLMQVRYEDALRYACDFDWQADKNLPLHDPDKTILQPRRNLMCGIHIMENQLIGLHRPLVTNKSYWGTLHPGTAGYRVFTKQMANVPVACSARPVHHLQQPSESVREAFAANASSPAEAFSSANPPAAPEP